MSTTVSNLRGDNESVSLPHPIYDTEHHGEANRLRNGVWITALYRGPRTGRMFARLHSIWDRGDGCQVGPYTVEVDRETFVCYCEIVGVDC